MTSTLPRTARQSISFQPPTLEFIQGGKPVKPHVVKAAANAAVNKARGELQLTTQRLAQEAARNRGFTVDQVRAWEREAKQATKDLIGASEALARGGFDRMKPAHWEAAAARCEQPFAAIERIAQRAISGVYGAELESGHFSLHISQVAAAGRSSYENARLDNATEELGHDEFKRLLGDSDSCTSARGRLGCIEAAEMDWCTRDEFIEIGGCTCHDGCNCGAISRRSGQAQRLAERLRR